MRHTTFRRRAGLVVAAAAMLTGVATDSVDGGAAPDPAAHVRQTLGFYPGFGAVQQMRQLEQELGFDVGVVVQFGGRSHPSELVGSVRAQLGDLADWIAERNPLYSVAVPLAFGGADARTDEGRQQVVVNLTETAAGEHDAAYEQVATLLVDRGVGNAVIRLGHEFDAVWYPWSAQPSCEGYIDAFRHVADLFRQVSPDFRFEWTGGLRAFSEWAACAYPGDDYVDIFGLTVFDKGGPIRAFSQDNETWLDPETVWAEQFIPNLEFHQQFATDHGKPVSYPEWGAVATDSGAYGGDNPTFIRSMAQWLRSLPTSGPGALMYHAYFMGRQFDVRELEQSAIAFFEEFGSPVS